jgi:hypothetical protein
MQVKKIFKIFSGYLITTHYYIAPDNQQYYCLSILHTHGEIKS